ncbi:hypothetical protein JJD41_04330 [Oxynema sp. CENA135]|uniref:hypothetical protein n=1 Tax=Oxynema sp. CENA135 TaxID=984206 RepID=UPI00190E0C51|nr:hypothetical protein [Oxynema sp. CENA135]MBK4729118.1 hypothetical protein [Oxynema sp. CENA135]
MSHDPFNTRVPPPCIVDTGIVVNKQDMLGVLGDLGRVRYVHWYGNQLHSEGDGYIMEVFADPNRSTLIANHGIYLNVCSFDCLELQQAPDSQSYFDLIQEGQVLRLIPLSNPLKDRAARQIETSALEAVLREVISAKLDAEIDDEGPLLF